MKKKELSDKTKALLKNSLEYYNSQCDTVKKEMVKHVRDQLILNEKGKNIGFPLDIDYVQAGKEFLKIVAKN